MPLYEFKCDKCKLTFVEYMGWDDDKTKLKCTKCPKGKLKQVICAPNVILKGSGWPGKDIKRGYS